MTFEGKIITNSFNSLGGQRQKFKSCAQTREMARKQKDNGRNTDTDIIPEKKE